MPTKQLERMGTTQDQIKGEVRLQILEQTFDAKVAAAKRCSEEAGAALREIREDRLYVLSGFQSFEAYCQQRWGFNRRYGDRLIEMADTCDALRADESARTQLPRSEWQQRPLGGLPPEEKRAAWAEAQEIAGGKPPTHRQVAKAVERAHPSTVVETPRPEPKPHIPAPADTLGAELAAMEERELLLEAAIFDVLSVWDARSETQESPAHWDARMDKLMERLRELTE